MCGIVSYYGKKNSVPFLINGLRRLEYRGYDSAGIALMDNGSIKAIKKAGKVDGLEQKIKENPIEGPIGIAHTRWATHGEPNDVNAHPHQDRTGKIFLIHNGIIENHSTLKEVLVRKGFQFKSQTDTEALVNLISDIYYADGLNFEQAVEAALKQVVGTYGIVAFCSDEPNKLVAARHGSPLVLGVGENEYFIASDASPIVKYTRNVIYLDEGEIVTVDEKGHSIRSMKDDVIVNRETTELQSNTNINKEVGLHDEDYFGEKFTFGIIKTRCFKIENFSKNLTLVN